MTTEISRRTAFLTVLATTAVATAANTAAIVTHAKITKPDPIFAAIEAHRAADEAVGEAVRAADDIDAAPDDPVKIEGERGADKAWQVVHAAELAFFTTIPTTVAGCLAALEYANGDDLGLDHDTYGIESIAAAVKNFVPMITKRLRALTRAA
jgi:hypothetical protein